MNEKVRKCYWYTLIGYLLSTSLNLSIVLLASDWKDFNELVKALLTFLVIIFVYCIIFYLIFYFVGKKSKTAWIIGFAFGLLGMFSPQFYSAFIFLTCLLVVKKFVFDDVNKTT